MRGVRAQAPNEEPRNRRRSMFPVSAWLDAGFMIFPSGRIPGRRPAMDKDVDHPAFVVSHLSAQKRPRRWGTQFLLVGHRGFNLLWITTVLFHALANCRPRRFSGRGGRITGAACEASPYVTSLTNDWQSGNW